MIQMRALLPLLLILVVGWSSSTKPAGADQTAAQRVILRVNRNLEIAGHIATEDENVIVVRTPQGELESFAKSRVAQIVRLTDPAAGQAGTVVLRDGDVREGIIIEDAFDHVLMEIHGIRAKLKRDLVSHVILQPSFDQRYADYKAALQPGHYDAHFVLCKWLFDQGRYELAQQELKDLLSKVDWPEARQLLMIVEAQVAMMRSQRPGKNEAGHAAPGGESVDPSSEDLRSFEEPVAAASQILSRADVNLIRVYEIDFDNPPRVSITPDTVRAIINNYGTSKLIPASQTGRNAMFRAAADRPLDVVRLMFDLRARDLYSQIQVKSEPHALNLFRQRIHDTWLMNNCAMSRCHGGPDAGQLYLHRKNYKDERVRYTNLLILERLQLDPEWPLINYDKPEDSLIIQYGLRREEARKPHPIVDGWSNAFPPTNPRMKQDAIEWIRSMMIPRPDYPVDFVPVPPTPTIPRAESDADRSPR